MTINPDHPDRRRGKSALRMCYSWAVPHGGNLLHLFWNLTGQDAGKAMCGRASFDCNRPIDRVGVIGKGVCPRCREIGLPGHPLPRGMA